MGLEQRQKARHGPPNRSDLLDRAYHVGGIRSPVRCSKENLCGLLTEAVREVPGQGNHTHDPCRCIANVMPVFVVFVVCHGDDL